MSRTDVHRPWPVQASDPHNRHLLYRYAQWPWATALTSYRNLCCGCHMCTGQVGRKYRHRQERVALRAQCREALKTTRSRNDRATLDIQVAVSPTW